MKLIVALLAVSAFTSSPVVAQISGMWRFDFERDTSKRQLLDAPATSECMFRQDGRRLTGNCGNGAATLMGIVNGRRVTLRVEANSVSSFTAELDAKATTMKGTWRDRERFGKFTATKQ
jgi:hypothetical protein